MAAISRQRCEFGKGNEDVQAAIAKAVELRAIHASLTQGNIHSPSSNLRLQSPAFSSQDYPIFNPTYEDEPLPGYHRVPLENRRNAESWGDYSMDLGSIDETASSDYRTMKKLEGYKCPVEDHESKVRLRWVVSPVPGSSKSRRNSLGDVKSVSSYNRCKPIVPNNYDSDSVGKTKGKPCNEIVTGRNKGVMFSWLFPKLKKKRNESSPVRPQSEEVSQMLKDLGQLSLETLKKELIEAQGSRDEALSEVSEIKSSLGELSQKLEYLETYCEELKNALRQAVQAKISQPVESLNRLPKKGKLIEGNLSDEAMVEEFLQVVSESRISVKQFCKALIAQVQETDRTLLDNLNALLRPYRLSRDSKHSKAVFYHLEAIVNQVLYQDFENCAYQKNGSPKLLDPHQERRANFQLFITIRNLRWNEVLRKGTKYYNDEFNEFCNQKMRTVLAMLGWTRPWPEQLLEAFFMGAKCLWLLHLLAFSFDPALEILRVDENRAFEAHYMDDIFADKERGQAPCKAKIMVMPGFYVGDKVLRCKVICRYKSST